MGKIRLSLPKEILSIGERIASAGGKTYLVGGSLRDFILKRDAKGDYDLATSLAPQRIVELFPRSIPTGIKHGTVTVLSGRFSVEVTTLRVDEQYVDGRHPESVAYTEDIVSDLARRDFTMNALAFDLQTGLTYDPFDGEGDIRSHIIRTVGDPDKRFSEDGLRPMRAIRFASQLGFDIEPRTFNAISSHLDTFGKVSIERARDELKKILLSPSPGRGLRLLQQSGLLEAVIPELSPCINFDQQGRHRFTLLEHLFRAVEAAPPDLVIRTAALFHDIGKPATFARDQEGFPTFYGHETVSADRAYAALRRLKFTNEEIDSIVHLIRQHMFNYDDSWSDSAVRRFIARVGEDSLDPLFTLRIADSSAVDGSPPSLLPLETLITRIETELERSTALKLRDLAIGGDDLARLGFPRGPVMGRALQDLLDSVLDDPDQNTKDRLERIALGLKIKYGL